MRRAAYLFLPIVAFLFGGAMASAQRSGISITPPELYPGVNEITVTAAKGISGIEAGGTENLTFEQVGSSSDGTTRTFRVVVYSGSSPVGLRLVVTDGEGRKASRRLGLGVHWTLDRVNLGRIQKGDKGCAEFSIRAVNNDVVERVTIDDSRLQINVGESLPYKLDGEYLRYNVCFKADVPPGVYKFPVTAWIRRDYPTAGETTYPISDTGYVVVVARDPDGRQDDPGIRNRRDLYRFAVPLQESVLTPATPPETPVAPKSDISNQGPTIGGNVLPAAPTSPIPTTMRQSETASRTLE